MTQQKKVIRKKITNLYETRKFETKLGQILMNYLKILLETVREWYVNILNKNLKKILI